MERNLKASGEKHVFYPEDCERVTFKKGEGYPPPFPDVVYGRALRRLGRKAGLENVAVVLVELAPGSALALRLRQSLEEEFFYVLEGEVTLVMDDGEEIMRAGACAGFSPAKPNGHQLINKSQAPARLIEIADIVEGNETTYSDYDLRAVDRDGERVFVNAKGDAYPFS
jgi:uncharacterized cupin superfamily protein